MKNIIVRFILTFSCIDIINAGEEQFLKHEELKEGFKLATFMVLSPDPQHDVLKYLQPDADEYREQLSHYDSGRLQELLVAEFFYNHAKKYDEKLKVKQGETNFRIKREGSQLSQLLVHNKSACHHAAMFDHIELLSIIIEVGADINQFVDRPLETALRDRSYQCA